jgi:hypothetical protein
MLLVAKPLPVTLRPLPLASSTSRCAGPENAYNQLMTAQVQSQIAALRDGQIAAIFSSASGVGDVSSRSGRSADAPYCGN